MADWVKIALKTGLIASGIILVFAVFANVQIPVLDFQTFFQAVGKGLAVCYYWLPISSVIFPVALALMGLELALITFKYTIIAVKTLMKVNE